MKPLSQARTKHLNCPLKYMQILVSRLSFLQVHRQMIERANILQLGYSILFFFFPQYFGANSTFILFLSHSDSCSHYSCNTEQIWKFIFNPSAPASSTIWTSKLSVLLTCRIQWNWLNSNWSHLRAFYLVSVIYYMLMLADTIWQNIHTFTYRGKLRL